MNALTADQGHLWVAEKLEDGSARTRVDEFDAASGLFLAQLQTGSLTGLDQGVAVGHVTGEEQVYVGAASEGKGVIAVFDASGAQRPAWTGAATPGGAFASVNGVAVDGFSNGLEDWAAGDVFVADQGARVVDVLKPGADGKEPAKADEVDQLTGTCVPPGPCTGEEAFSFPTAVAVSGFNGDVLVVDAAQTVDMFKPGAVTGEYEFIGKLAGPPPGGAFEGVAGLAVDSASGEIYVNNGVSSVDEFSAAGVYLGHLTGTPSSAWGLANSVRGLAVDPVTHRVYVGNFDQSRLIGQLAVFGPNVVVPDVVTGGSVPVVGSATLNGTVDPKNAGEASCGFAWGTTTGYGRFAPCSAKVPNGEGEVPVQASLSGLAPDTVYHYRLQASNEHGTNPGEEWQDHELLTPGPGLHGESVSGVASTSATFEAAIDPHGAPTSYYFQYGTSTGYGSATPSTAIGSGEGDVVVPPRHVQDLAPGTLYHYRVVAVSELGSFPGADQTFTTQSAGSGSDLADGRQWELVSPADKHGALLLTIGEGHVTQAAASGNAVTYVASAPTEGAAAGFSNFVQVLSTRTAAGVWQSRDIASPHDAATGIGGSEYRLFSRNLEAGVLQPRGPFTPSVSAEASEQTAYLHTNLLPTGALCDEGCYQPLVTGCPPPGQECNPTIQPHANVPRGTAFGEEGSCPSASQKETCGPLAIGASPDLEHIILRSNDQIVPLTTDADPSRAALYEWTGGHLALVNRLPNGEQAPDAALGLHGVVNRNAVSSDGSRVIWSEAESALYLRDTVKGKTLQLDKLQGGTGEGRADPVFQDASADGAQVFFTDDQELTEAAGKEGNLYRCTVVEEHGELHCRLTDLTPVGSSGEPPKVRGEVIGASEDGSWVYFVADGALTPDAAPGTCPKLTVEAPPSTICKLYVSHNGVTKLVASLSAADGSDWNGGEDPRHLVRLTSRVSPDGQWLAFMSQRPLTGYDNRDAKTGKPDEEVYLYDGKTGHLVCASCNPTAGRPTGVEYDKTLEGLDGASYQIWDPGQGLAGSLPAWTSYGGFGEAAYQPHYLADNGRVIFNSSDGLVPQDGNGVGDVYQFEPSNVGDCAPATSTGGNIYVPQSAGCVGLISSGNSKDESAFLDASSTGGRDPEGHEGAGDVFFLTTVRLAKEDFDGALDVYTAHECTTAAPCPPAPATSPPPCENEESCKGSNTPQPQLFGAPATSTFTGAGNQPPALSPPAVKTHSLTRSQRLARAMKACRAKRNRHKRAACESQARRRFGPKRARKAGNHRRGK